MPQFLIGQKLIGGFLTLIFICSINIGNLFSNNYPEIDVKINNHEETTNYLNFYGTFNIDGEKHNLILSLDKTESYKKEEKKEDKKEDKNINENKNIREDKNNKSINENTNIKDDKTPGRFKIIIENKNGEKVKIDNDYGSGTKSEFDKICEEKILNEVTEYIRKMKDKSFKERFINMLYGFVDYCNKDRGERKLLKKLINR